MTQLSPLELIMVCLLLLFLLILFGQFRPSFTKKITDDLFVVNSGMVNFYVYQTGGGVLLFDTGLNPSLAKRGLKRLGIAPSDVTHIFLTHSDYDHTGGISAFPNAQRLLSVDEEQMINGKTARRGFIHNIPFSPYSTLADGESVAIHQSTIQIHVTPGHTPGSAIYMIDHRYLVTGDLLRISRRGEIKPFTFLMNQNHKQDRTSIRDVKDIIDSAEYLLTAHTGFYKNIE